MLELDVEVLVLLSGTVVPLLVGLVTKLGASKRLKSILNLILSVAAGALTWMIAAGGKFTWHEAAFAAASAYIASGVSYQNLWKPSGAAESVAVATATFGAGSNIELLQYQADVEAEINAAGARDNLAAVSPPVADESARITTLKGAPVYSDPCGYLFTVEPGV